MKKKKFIRGMAIASDSILGVNHRSVIIAHNDGQIFNKVYATLDIPFLAFDEAIKEVDEIIKFFNNAI